MNIQKRTKRMLLAIFVVLVVFSQSQGKSLSVACV